MKTAYDKIKAGILTVGQANANVMAQIANRPTYRKLPIHVLVEDYLAPNYLDISHVIRYAKINPRRMQSLLHGDSKIDKLVAEKLGTAFRTGAQYWLDIQDKFDRGEAL